MKYFKFLYIAVLGLFASGCTDDCGLLQKTENNFNGDSLEIEGSIYIPGLSMTATRGEMSDYPTDGSLKLTILEFSAGDDAESSFMTNIYKAVCSTTTAVTNGGIVTFSVTLTASTEGRRLHLIVADDYVTPDFGSEAAVFTSTKMTVGPNKEAYWGSVLVKDGYVSVTQNSDNTTTTTPKTDYVKGLLTNVPVIRNFAKVTVTESLDNFEVLGWELVNVPTMGSIVPWDASSLSIPQLLNNSNMKDFADISYGGFIPENSGFNNQETDDDFKNSSWNQSTWSSGARYLYEHPYESSRHTFLVIYGSYTNSDGSTNNGYYKVDFGKQTNVGFEYYNIIRNYNYLVTITSVNAVGFSTLATAIDGKVFNNITADVKMLSLSDGDNMLTVNATTHIFVQTGTDQAASYTLEAVYMEDVTDEQTVNSSKLKTLGLTQADIDKGDVIASVDSTTSTAKKTYTITPKTLSTNQSYKEQSFTIFDGNGIGRVITLILIRPYEFKNVIVNKYAYNEPISSSSQTIGTEQGESFTLYFNLPAGMPEEIFPLTFQIQSQNQIIENNQVGTLVVLTGASLFYPYGPAISYLKTVEYNEYEYKYETITSNELDLSEINSDHTIRCRFKTTIDGTGTDSIMVHNTDGYFIDYKLNVTR